VKVEEYNAKPPEIGKVSLVKLDRGEWISFLQKMSDAIPYNADTKDTITQSDLNWIDTNYCVPLLINSDLTSEFGCNTKYISVVEENHGMLYLRYWLAENNLATDLNNVLDEVFPGILATEVLNDFWSWWSKLPTEPQNVAGQLISKQYIEFGLGHFQAWVKQIIGGEEPKPAIDRYRFHLLPWMYAYEMNLHWIDQDLINNVGGKITPKSR